MPQYNQNLEFPTPLDPNNFDIEAFIEQIIANDDQANPENNVIKSELRQYVSSPDKNPHLRLLKLCLWARRESFFKGHPFALHAVEICLSVLYTNKAINDYYSTFDKKFLKESLTIWITTRT